MTQAAPMRLLTRRQVKPADTWDLSSIFPGDEQWESAFRRWEKQVSGYEAYRGKLAESPAMLAAALRFDVDFDRRGERIGHYAFLKTAEDMGESRYQAMKARYLGVASRAAQAASFLSPEILAIPAAKMKKFLADPVLAEFKVLLERILRRKPHTLSEKEERLLAMQTEMAQAAGQIFQQLNNVDLKFGIVKDAKGQSVELSHATFSTLLHSPSRKVRQAAFKQYYAEYADHAHTIAASLTGSIHRDVYYARARNFPCSLEAALFEDNVPVKVYDNLIKTVRRHLPALYRYFEVRRRRMKLDRLHHYDTYVPILTDLEVRRNWKQATDVVLESLEPLGSEYVRVLGEGLRGRWCDRYENKGKQSGAFSSGGYDGHPYILMNYRPEVLSHVFTLTHEAGHAMHSFFSARAQPYQYYNYTIFVAEVASTFNEQLLSRHLLAKAKSNRERAYILNREIDDIRGTIFRQTMFAEFERITHELAEKNEPLTLERFREEYGKLLAAYFGPDFAIDEELSLECLRIPHFYRAFYVYKYATGMSAAIALARRVVEGGKAELDAYLSFLSGGCSKFPLELLQDAGVDMARPGPIDAAMEHFGRLVDELDELI